MIKSLITICFLVFNVALYAQIPVHMADINKNAITFNPAFAGMHGELNAQWNFNRFEKVTDNYMLLDSRLPIFFSVKQLNLATSVFYRNVEHASIQELGINLSNHFDFGKGGSLGFGVQFHHRQFGNLRNSTGWGHPFAAGTDPAYSFSYTYKDFKNEDIEDGIGYYYLPLSNEVNSMAAGLSYMTKKQYLRLGLSFSYRQLGTEQQTYGELIQHISGIIPIKDVVYIIPSFYTSGPDNMFAYSCKVNVKKWFYIGVSGINEISQLTNRNGTNYSSFGGASLNLKSLGTIDLQMNYGIVGTHQDYERTGISIIYRLSSKENQGISMLY